MKYIVRLNPRAVNPITHDIDVKRFWEVEQCANKDSEKVIWHCASVRVGNEDIQSRFQAAQKITVVDIRKFVRHLKGWATPEEKNKPAEPAVELEFWGICTIGQDNALVIQEGRHDVG